MKWFKSFVHSFGLMLFISILAACGGGGSDSGGGGASFAGTYSGTWNATMAGAGQSRSGTGVIVIVINPDNTVVIDPNTPVPGAGNITGNTISAGWAGSSFNTPGITCSGGVTIGGPVSGESITGTIGPSTLTCNGVAFSIQGTFTAAKTAKTLLDGLPVRDEFRNTVREALGQ